MKKKNMKNIKNIDKLLNILANLVCIIWVVIMIFGVNIAVFFKNQYVETGKLGFVILYGLMWRIRRSILWIMVIAVITFWIFVLCQEHKNKRVNRIVMKAVIPLGVILIGVLLFGKVPLPFDCYKTPDCQKMNMGRFICAVIKDNTTKETLTIEVDDDSYKIIKNRINESRKGISRNVENVKYLVLEKEGYQIPLFDYQFGKNPQRITIHKYTGLIISVE